MSHTRAVGRSTLGYSDATSSSRPQGGGLLTLLAVELGEPPELVRVRLRRDRLRTRSRAVERCVWSTFLRDCALQYPAGPRGTQHTRTLTHTHTHTHTHTPGSGVRARSGRGAFQPTLSLPKRNALSAVADCSSAQPERYTSPRKMLSAYLRADHSGARVSPGVTLAPFAACKGKPGWRVRSAAVGRRGFRLGLHVHRPAVRMNAPRLDRTLGYAVRPRGLARHSPQRVAFPVELCDERGLRARLRQQRGARRP